MNPNENALNARKLSFVPGFGYLKNELGVVISKLVLAKISEPVDAEMKIKTHI